jgi:hypothetical protein
MILAQTELAEQTVIHVAQEFAWLLLGAVLIGILADPAGSIRSARGPLRRMVDLRRDAQRSPKRLCPRSSALASSAGATKTATSARSRRVRVSFGICKT